MTEIVSKALSIILSLGILAQAVAVRRIVGTWLFPACLFGLLWFGFTFVPLVMLLNIPSSPLAIAYILLCCLVMSLCGLTYKWKAAFSINRALAVGRVSRKGISFLTGCFYAVSGISIALMIENLLVQGFAVSDYTHRLVESSSRYASMRGSGELRANIFGQLSLVCVYIGASLGGVLVTQTENRRVKTRIILVSLLPSILVMLTQSAKGALYLSLAFYYAGILLGWIRSGTPRIFSRRAMRVIIVYGAITTLLVGVSFLARGLYDERDPGELRIALEANFSSYLFGSMYAMCDWLSFYVGRLHTATYALQEHTYGFYTFTPIFRLFGSTREMPPGVFEDYYIYGPLATNIFTVFRCVITDFGIFGCVVFIALLSFIWHTCFYFLLVMRENAICAAGFILLFGFAWHSYLGSMLMYNNVYLCFCVLALIFWIHGMLNRNQTGNYLPAKQKEPRRTRSPASPRHGVRSDSSMI